MAASSSADATSSLDRWTRVQHVLVQCEVPFEAWPAEFSGYPEAYKVCPPEGSRGFCIRVLPLAQVFCMYQPGASQLTIVPWEDDPGDAWERAKTLADWHQGTEYIEAFELQAFCSQFNSTGVLED